MHEKDFITRLAPYAKRLFQIIKNNIWYIIWFCVYFQFSLSFFLPFFRWNTLYICLALYGVSILVALIFGDFIFGLIEGVRKLETKREKEYLIPIFEEVYQKAKTLYPSMPKVKLHIIDTMTVNGVAIGNRTVAVTQGAIETFNDEELKGIIAHELSHIYYGDSKMAVINTIGNGIFTILILIIKLILKGLEYIAMMCDSTPIQAVFSLFRFIFELFIFCILWLGDFILSFNNRGSELRADKFAYELGYGEQLTNALYIIQKMSLGQKMRLVSKLQASHPRVSKRIGKIEALIDAEIQD